MPHTKRHDQAVRPDVHKVQGKSSERFNLTSFASVLRAVNVLVLIALLDVRVKLGSRAKGLWFDTQMRRLLLSLLFIFFV
jgi:hypothetical protein